MYDFVECTRVWAECIQFHSSLVSYKYPGAVDKLRAFYQRIIAVDSEKMNDIWKLYVGWEESLRSGAFQPPGPVKKSHDKALAAFKTREPLEQGIKYSSTDGQPNYNLLGNWHTYLEFEEGQKHKTNLHRTYCLFERGLKAYPQLAALWLRYIVYVERAAPQNTALIRRLYERGVRCCYWNGQLWAGLLRCLERADQDPLPKLMEATKVGLQSDADYYEVFQAYVAALRRKGPPEAVLEGLDLCLNFLDQYLPKSESKMKLLLAKAKFLVKKDLAATEEVFKQLEHQFATNGYWWVTMNNLLEGHAEPAIIRANFKKAASAAHTGLDSVFRAWIDFEQEYGSISDYSFAWSSAATKLKSYTLFPPQNPETALKRTLPSEQAAKRRKTALNTKEKQPRKRDKKPDDGLNARERELQTIFISNISFTADQLSLQEAFAEYKPKEIRLVPGAGGQGHRGLAFIEFSNQVDANNALKLDGHILNSRPIKVTPSDNQIQGLSQRKPQTVFVTNLPYDVTADELRGVFSPAGTIADIRIPLEKEGKNRGFAYVEFVQPADAIKALGMDKTEIKKRKINVEPYVRKSAAPAAPTGEAGPTTRKRPTMLVPAVLQRKKVVPPPAAFGMGKEQKDAGAEGASDKPQAKSNNEFRKMLLNK